MVKVLHFPAYVSIDTHDDFSRSTSGYGYMALDIATSLAKHGIEVDLLTQSNITEGMEYNSVTILKRTWWNIISHIRFSDMYSALITIVRHHIPLRKIPNIILYNISMGYFLSILKQNKYDIIHIHGIGHYTVPIINTCEEYNVKYVVTLHGLNSFSESVEVSKWEKQIEKEFITTALEMNTTVTVISTGVRETILNYLNNPKTHNFAIICNACETKVEDIRTTFSIREKYDIQENNKIFLCVGNIGKNKNQSQIVRSFSLLPDKIKRSLSLLLLGHDSTNGLIQNEIDSLGLNAQIKICGHIPKNEVAHYYQEADYNIVASISEGYGLSMIEGFVHGLPTLTFRDLDAVKDVFHPGVIFLAKERSDVELKNGIVTMLRSSWDRSFIVKYAQNYSYGFMAAKYAKVYARLLNLQIR